MKKYFLFSLIHIIALNCFSQYQTAMIEEGVAIFYPENFNPQSHLPSFALIEEPVSTGPLPSGWKMRVLFDIIAGKSLARIKIDPETDIYGTGEVTGKLLRNGTTRKLYNLDNFAYQRDHGLRLYQSHPWVLGVRKDGTSFGILADITWKQEIAIGEEVVFSSPAPPFRVIVIEKESPQEVLEFLSGLTGNIPLPPLWSLGYQQCRWSYYPDSRVREIADTFRMKKIPCDVIWMDIHYMDGYRVFTFSPEYFPDPVQTNDYLHEKGFKSIWMIDPGVKKEKGYFVYDSGTEKDVWVKTRDGENYVGRVWPGDCVFPDFTQPKTAEWWAGLYQDFMTTGIDGVWNDMNEPAVFNGVEMTMPDDNVHRGGGELPEDVHLRYHNVYGMMMVKASRKGIQKANPDRRPFVLTRSNYLGGQRYAATWTGDNVSSMEHLKLSIPMSLNLSLSGQPFNGPDVGGFAGNATPELYGHWISLGTFYPFFRGHSISGSDNHEPWSFGEEIESVARQAIERRYRLLPYLYTCFYEASTTGMPVMQPLFFADITDEKLRGEEEAFLFGSDIMVIPKWSENSAVPEKGWESFSLEGEPEKSSYLPEMRIRPGAIVPVGNVIQNTEAYSLDTLTLFINPDAAGYATGKLYHDAGEGYGYTKGEYALITVEAVKNDDVIRVGIKKIEGNYPFENKHTIVFLIQEGEVIKEEGRLIDGVEINGFAIP